MRGFQGSVVVGLSEDGCDQVMASGQSSCARDDTPYCRAAANKALDSCCMPVFDDHDQ